MGRIEVHSPVFERMNLIKQSKEIVQLLEDLFSPLYLDVKEGDLRTAWENIIQAYRADLQDPDLDLEEARKINTELREFLTKIQEVFTPIQDGEGISVEAVPGEEGLRKRAKFTFTSQESPETRDPLKDLEEIRHTSKPGVVRVSKDFTKSLIDSSGKRLDLGTIKDEKTRRTIQRKVEEGKYIAGTLVGLSGGERYFKVFCLALAQILNEQSKYYKTEEDLSGVPKDLITQYAGEGAIIENLKPPTDNLKGGKRSFPIVFLSWEDIAKKMSATGQISGGKDIKQVRDYVLGGMQKRTDRKTGNKKEVFVPGLLGREYLVEGKNSIIGVPLMTKIFSLYPKDSPDKEVGIAVQLSPLFTLASLGYTGIRSDTIRLLGGGNQREITLNLFIFLAYNRGVPPQTGRKKGEFLKKKTDLLRDLSRGLSSYVGRPGLLEKHFQEAVQKCTDAKILLPGKTKTGLRGYREEKNPGGEILSVFVYNPDYLKGEEVNLFSEIEDQ